MVVSLCGTAADPQDREAQAAALVAAGAWVFASNAAAARAAASLTGAVPATPTAAGSRQPASEQAVSEQLSTRVGTGGVDDGAGGPAPDTAVLTAPGSVICAGIDLLADALRAQAVEVVAVDYHPTVVRHRRCRRGSSRPAFRARRPARGPANALAAERMLAVRALLVDVRPASEALGLRRGEFCHAGPPIDFARASGPLRGALIGAMIFEGLADDEAEAIAKLGVGRRHLAVSRATTGMRSARWPG